MKMRDRKKSRVPQPSDSPLFVVCGLPLSNYGKASSLIEKAFNAPCKIINPPSGLQDSSIYSDSYNRIVIAGMCEFLIRRRKDTKVITPSKVILLYVPTSDAERLLAKLDFAVFPIKLDGLEQWDQVGRLHRHNGALVEAALIDAVGQVKIHHEFFERFENRRPTDAILLPPENFHVSDKARLSALFKEMRSGLRDWRNRFPELTPKEYLQGDLPKVHGPGRFLEDCREVIFVLGPEHGNSWTVDESEASEARLLHGIKGMYRFGAAMPHGFQHDAQLKNATFKKFSFDCSEEGLIFVTDNHADIYLNDKVRHRTKQ